MGRQYLGHAPDDLAAGPAASGKDDFGNRYYEQKKGVGPLGVPRRWVTYTDFAEASKVPAGWHGWLHYTVDTPPTEQNYRPRPWQRPHLMNMTGTPGAYRPPGSILGRGVRAKATGDYKPWRPDSVTRGRCRRQRPNFGPTRGPGTDARTRP